MKSLVFSALLFVSITAIPSQELAKGPQKYTNSDVNAPAPQNSTQKLQKRLATKEIIMYLTSTQIKNLQSGLAYITSRPLDKYDGSGLNQEKEYLYNMRNLNDDMKELKNLETLKPITEFQDENLQMPIFQNKQEPQLLYSDLERLKDSNQLQGQQKKELASPKYQWIPYNPVEFHSISNNKYQDILLKTQNKEDWNPILEFEHLNSQILPNLQQFKGLEMLLSQEKSLLFNYAPSYSDNKNIDLKLQHMNEIEKQKMLSQMEAIVSQNKATKEFPTSNYEHIALPLAINTEPFCEKNTKPKPSVPSPFY